MERPFRPQSHGTREDELCRTRRFFEKYCEPVYQQGLRNTVEHGADQGFEAHLVCEGASELDERAAVIEPGAIKKTGKASLDPSSHRLKQECRDTDCNHAARRTGGPARVKRLAY